MEGSLCTKSQYIEKLTLYNHKKMNISFCVVFLISMLGFCQADMPTILTKLAEYLRAPKPLPIHYNATLESKVTLAKKMAQKGSSIRWVDQVSTSETFLLILLQEYSLGNENVEINQQIYFLTPSLELHEKYTVNGHVVTTKLVYFVGDLLIPIDSIEQSFWKRRKDFHGFQMIGMTDTIPSAIQINIENATYFPTNQTYDVTTSMQGSYFDIWKNLQRVLNFTTKIYKRKERNWGVPIQLSNGTIELSDGMIKDVMIGKAHVLMSAASVLYARYLVIDYLQPIMRRDGGIFVSKDALQEGFDFKVFYHPFAKWTWMLIVFSSLMVTLCIILLWKISNTTEILPSSIKVLIMSLKVNLGTNGFSSVENHTTSLKFLFFTTLLMGNVIWLSYNGALLSELITPKVVKPFHDLDTLIKSKYR